MRSFCKYFFFILITSSPVLADDWFVSKFGKDDTLGAINHIDADKTKDAAALVKQGKTISLGMVTTANDAGIWPSQVSNDCTSA